MPEPSVSSIAIYQLRVVLCGVSPLVWRRLLVVSTTSIAELHEIPQSAFGWSGEHLHRFLIHGAAYGIAHLDGIVLREDARGVPFPVSVCIVASASAMNTTSRPSAIALLWPNATGTRRCARLARRGAPFPARSIRPSSRTKHKVANSLGCQEDQS